MREEYEEDYQGEIERYKEALAQWKEYIKQKVGMRPQGYKFSGNFILKTFLDITNKINLPEK